MVNHDQMETLHLYVVPEDQLPPPHDYVGVSIATLCSLFLVGLIGLIVVSPKDLPTVSFFTTITGYQLPAVSKSIHLTIQATGKGHTNATYAQGAITFYNGQTYTQIIPVGTILKGVDGVAVITDTQAVIPPAAQTTPPTYGHTTVPAHALYAGASGNIQAGDINQACCVTSVIAQNPYTFTGGANARDFTFLTAQDVSYNGSDTVQKLEEQTKSLFTSKVVLDPTCTTTHSIHPAIGSETHTALLSLTCTCSAISYSPFLAKQQIETAGKHYGNLRNIQFSIVGISQRRGVVSLRVYVTAIIVPLVRVPVR